MNFGPLSHYNGIIYNTITSLQADCEGAMAVGGNAQFGSSGFTYDIGASGSGVHMGDYSYIGDYDNTENHPTLVLGGLLDQNSNNCRFHNGNLVMKAANQAAYETSSVQLEIPDGFQIHYVDDSLVDDFFEYAQTTTSALSTTLAGLSNKKLTLDVFSSMDTLSDLTEYEVTLKDGSTALVFNLDAQGEDPLSIKEVHFPGRLTDYELIVINTSAENVKMVEGALLLDGTIINTSSPKAYEENKVMRKLTSRIIWNFPDTSVYTIQNYGIVGSILAPKATISTVGGSVNGMLITDTLNQTGGFELHGFTICKAEKLWELIEVVLTGSVEIIKVDSTTPGLLLPGAQFNLYKKVAGQWIDYIPDPAKD